MSQIVKLFAMAILLCITPLLNSPFRPPYIYFVASLIIVALGAEAGLLSFLSKITTTPDHHNNAAHQKPAAAAVSSSDDHEGSVNAKRDAVETPDRKKPKAVEKSATPSTPSLFFIGGGESSNEEDQDHEGFMIEEEEDDHDYKQDYCGEHEINGQELFQKAETFIGNFYKELKMQREDSWKKIHGLS